jgi:hypothetical protein
MDKKDNNRDSAPIIQIPGCSPWNEHGKEFVPHNCICNKPIWIVLQPGERLVCPAHPEYRVIKTDISWATKLADSTG